MRRMLCSLLLLFSLLTSLVFPIFAAEEGVPSAEDPAIPLQESEILTEAPLSAQPTEVLPSATGGFTVSAAGLAFLGEMMTYNATQLAAAEKSVNAFIDSYALNLNQAQFDALVDLEMAYGGRMFSSGYQVEKVIASGSYTDAKLATAFCAWVKGTDGNLSQARLNRRLREIKLFLYGSYDGICEADFRYVIYDANGGTLNNNMVICYSLNEIYGELPTASREGQHFLGWFTAASGGTQLLPTSTVTDNLRLYAHWSTEAPQQGFIDVPLSAWYYPYVSTVVEAGYFSGVSATEFEPEEPLTRAMLATVLWRMDGEHTAGVQAPFLDVPEGQWFTEAIDWAYETGVVNGVSATEFEPEAFITREQLTTMLYRYASTHGYDVSGQNDLTAFSDADTLSAYAVAPMKWAVSAGIVNGDSGQLRPLGNATRAECAKMIAMFSALNPGNGSTPTPSPDPTLKISEACIQFIKDNEGFSKYAYWDYGQYSIGYGSHCDPEDYPDGITEDEADHLLRVMLADFETVVDKALAKGTVVHTQNQYDAIVSLTYNLGQQWMNSKYQIYDYLLFGGFTELEFLNTLGSWSNAGGGILSGLCLRRMEEADMYLNGDYTLNNAPYRCLIYNAASGTADDKVEYFKVGSTIHTLPSATREGYRFLGWFDKAAGGKEYTVGSALPSSRVTTLYAHWEKLPEGDN